MGYAELLRRYIEDSGKTLEEISDQCKEMGVSVHPTYISKLRLGSRSVPSDNISKALAIATGGDPDKLIWSGIVVRSSPFFQDILLEADENVIGKAIRIAERHPGFFNSYDPAHHSKLAEDDPLIKDFWQELGRAIRETNPPSSEVEEKMTYLPIAGKIACGNGQLAYQDIEGHEPTPKDWLNGGEYFYLRAKGDSMTGARIQDGDLLLIRKQPSVEEGEIAAVMINDEAKLKRVFYRNNTLILQSENPKYPPEVFTEGDITIIGKLKKVIMNL